MITSTTPWQGGTLSGRFVRHTVASEHLGGERGVTVRLPDHYSPETKTYPVVYLHDGQNMFDRRTGFAGREWHVDEIAGDLTRQGRLPEAIYVAIDHGPDRLGEYSHVPDPKHGGGQGERYENFLIQELMPSLEQTYAIDPRQRVMLGSSMGGLVTLAIGLAHPAAFAALGPLSSSVWWADGKMADSILERAPVDGPKPRIWMDMGTEEGGSDAFGTRPVEGGRMGARPEGPNGVPDVRDRTREAATALLHKGWTLDKDLRYHEPLGGRHDEASWSGRLDQVLPWLMKDLSARPR